MFGGASRKRVNMIHGGCARGVEILALARSNRIPLSVLVIEKGKMLLHSIHVAYGTCSACGTIQLSARSPAVEASPDN